MHRMFSVTTFTMSQQTGKDKSHGMEKEKPHRHKDGGLFD
jgi:hypothetical protein